MRLCLLLHKQFSVWDKVIAGSSTVLVYVAVALILDRKQYLMAVKSKDGMYEIFQDVRN